MQNHQQHHINPSTLRRHDRAGSHSLKVLSFLFLLTTSLTGCVGTAPLHLQKHFPIEAQPSETLKAKSSPSSSEKVPVGVAIALLPDSYDFPLADEETWIQLAARVKDDVESTTPVLMEKVIVVKDLGSPESLSLIQKFGRDSQIDTILVVLPSGTEVSGPVRFPLLPEVSFLNGRQIDHHATVELGLVDTKSGKLLLQVQGNSYATLDELDTPINSNRYPRVKGSAMSSYMYPEQEKALETLRAVALDEALEQATMKLQEKWSKT